MKSEQGLYVNWQERLKISWPLRQLATFFAIYAVLFYFGVGAWLIFRNEFWLLSASLLAVVISRGVLTEAISFFYHKLRPYQKYNFRPSKFSWFFSYETGKPASFPSGHAAAMASLSMVLFIYYPVLGLVGFLIALLAGFARVVMGYHFVIDIIAGLAIGLLSGVVAVLLL